MYYNEWKIDLSTSIAIVFIHLTTCYGLYSMIIGSTLWQTIVWSTFIHLLSAPGVTAGAHRLWSHRSYKAKWPLRLILMLSQTLSLQRDIYEWAADHRVHHKYSETDADPHNAKRGFFFSHIGWLLVEKHPDVIKKAKNIDLSDLLADPIVYYQRKYYIPLVVIIWGFIPIFTPYYYWNESLINSFTANVTRYVFMLHCAFFVNSVAHLWGERPYDKDISPSENRSVAWLTIGEGYHNYHHVFPYDYSTGEYSWEENFNVTTMLIDFCSRIGWAYDMRKPSAKTIEATRLKYGQNIDNKPKSLVFDYIYGFAFQTVILWSTLITRFLLTIIYS